MRRIPGVARLILQNLKTEVGTLTNRDLLSLNKMPALLCVIALTVYLTTSEAASLDASDDNSPAERYVALAVAVGVLADLSPTVTDEEKAAINELSIFQQAYSEEASLAMFKSQFTNENARILDARTLINLLTSTNSAVTRHGVRISRAVFTNAVDLQNADISYDLSFTKCVFKTSMDFRQSRFRKSVVLDGSTFQGWVNFYGASIGAELFANQVTNTSSYGTCFASMKVAGSAYLKDASFITGADFSFSTIGKDLYVGNTAFGGWPAFCHLDVGLDFHAEEAHFENSACFGNMKIKGSALFTNAVFGGADFTLADVHDHINANSARFTNRDARVTFNSVNVGKALWLSNAVLSGSADFSHAQIARNLECDDVRFANSTKRVVFADMNVGGAIVCRRAEFDGPVDFRHVNVGDNFRADGAQFMAPSQEGVTNDFTDLKVAESISIPNVIFLGMTSFERARVGGDFIADSATNEAWTSFYRMRVDGTGFFRCSFSRAIDLTQASFGSLDLSGINCPKDPGSVKLDGLSYHSIAWSGKDSLDSNGEYERLLNLYDSVHAGRDAYTTLETFYRRQAMVTIANRVYIAARESERRDWREQAFAGDGGKRSFHERAVGMFYWIGCTGWLWLCGYGHRLWLGAIWSGFIIVIGWLVFRNEHDDMELHAHHVMVGSSVTVAPDPEKVSRFSPFWYSVDLFIPLLDLGDAKNWMPKKERPGLRFYRRVHMIAGACLVPITLAALAGIIN